MKQVSASLIDKRQILSQLPRLHARSILNSQLIWLDCPEIAKEAKPGQFVMVHCGQECLLARPFSIHQLRDNSIALFFSVLESGKGTVWLSQRQKGDIVDLYGPLGNGFSIDPASHHLLLVAGGIGIAPLYFLAQKALSKGCSVTLLLGAQTAAQLYPERLLPTGIKLVTATEDGTTGKKGMITSLLPDFAGWADQVFACGPMGMYRDMADRYHQFLKNKPVQVSLEVRMGCGLGCCYACTIKTRGGLRQVCQDGPVFDLRDILWD